MINPRSRAPSINDFIRRRSRHWERLEVLLKVVESAGLGSLAPHEVREFGGLYRRASSDLVSARSRGAGAEIIDYLNDLVARAYSHVYGARGFQASSIAHFLSTGFPDLCRRYAPHCWASAALMLLGILFGWQLYLSDPDGAFRLLPPGLVSQLPDLRSHWSERTGHAMPVAAMPVLSSYIMTHNISIGLLCFAGGLTLGVIPVWALLTNGMMVGVLGAAMSGPRTALTFWSLILPHGILELTAIAIEGGAGFVLASALIAPGRQTRTAALRSRGRDALLIALGGAAMLVVAGLIEGFITPTAVISPAFKLLFAAGSAVGLVYYFGRSGKKSRLPEGGAAPS